MSFLRNLFSSPLQSQQLREAPAPREHAQIVADYLCTALADKDAKRFHEHDLRVTIRTLDRI